MLTSAPLGNSYSFRCIFNCQVIAIVDDNFDTVQVRYNSSSNALASLSMTAQPVPLESDALPIISAAVFMAGGVWWKRRRAKDIN